MTLPSLYHWTSQGPADLQGLLEWRNQLRLHGQRLVTTNGCFDIIHVGHINFLQDARTLGDALVIGLNSDSSVRQIKGAGRPFILEKDRATILSALRFVDGVVVFSDLLPNEFISQLRPDIHVKAGDYTEESLPEASVVRDHGGRVMILPITNGYSTTMLVQRITANVNPAAAEQSDYTDSILKDLLAGSNLIRLTAYQLSQTLNSAVDLLLTTLKRGNKILICGNGRCAVDAQYFAAELSKSPLPNRHTFPALALSCDFQSTAAREEIGPEQALADQVAFYGKAGDALISLYTNELPKNLLTAIKTARNLGLKTICMSGSKPFLSDSMPDIQLAAPATHEPFIHQIHLAILNILSDRISKAFEQL